MASPEIESHARSMLANRLVAVRRLDEALRSADEAAQGLREARARARAEYAAARRAGWSKDELNRLGLSRDRTRRSPAADTATAGTSGSGASGGAPADLPSRAATRPTVPPATDLFRPRSATPAGVSRDEIRGNGNDGAGRPSRTGATTAATTPASTPVLATPGRTSVTTPATAPAATPARTPVTTPVGTSTLTPASTPDPSLTTAPLPQAIVNGRSATGPAATDPAVADSAVADSAATPDDPGDDTVSDKAGSDTATGQGDWYVDTQAARAPVMSGIPSPARSETSSAEDKSD